MAFDAAVYFLLIVAVVMGFRSGLLRALATIVGYLAAAPVVVAATPLIATLLADAPAPRVWLALGGVFVVMGIVLGALCRAAVTAMFGPTASLPDRAAGALLGAARIGLLAVLMVAIFDRVIPPNVQLPFLADSRLRPLLSPAAAAGLRSLPPDVEDFIERWKRTRGLAALHAGRAHERAISKSGHRFCVRSRANLLIGA